MDIIGKVRVAAGIFYFIGTENLYRSQDSCGVLELDNI
jgi:hypothetical protein